MTPQFCEAQSCTHTFFGNEPHFKFTIQKRKQINLIFQMQDTSEL